MATASPKLYGLDHLRAFAIAFVLLYHYGVIFHHPDWAKACGTFGWSGVDLFFVLSGFLISSELFREADARGCISFARFFTKRVFRIFPGYWLMLALYVLFPLLRERGALSAPLWRFLTFTQNINLHLDQGATFSHAWSLCIEEQFYFVLPLCLIGLLAAHRFRRGIWIVAALFLAGFAIRYFVWMKYVQPVYAEGEGYAPWHRLIYYSTVCRLDGLLAGITVSAFVRYRPRIAEKIMRRGNLILLLALAVLAGAYFLCADESSFAASVWGFPLVAVGYGLLVLAAISPSCFLYRPLRVTSWIAALSYALYLSHKLIINQVQEHAGFFHLDPDGNGMLLLCAAACLAGAQLMRFFPERPMLRLRDRVLKQISARQGKDGKI